MREVAVPLLNTWQNFYVIIGSASATLTGLMFVVITLGASRRRPGSGTATGVFSTPTIVHLSAALLISAVMCAPWPALWYAASIVGICGLVGVLYCIIVLRRVRRQTAYQPVLEDWLWHTIIPFLAYAALFVSALMILSNMTLGLFIVGTVTVLFLFTGIHNAWDNITYMTFTFLRPDNEKPQQ